MLRLDGERIILRQRMHWAFFILPGISGFLLSLPFFVTYLLLGRIFNTGESHLPPSITFLSLALSLAPIILFLLLAIGTFFRSKIVLTNERFTYSAGLLFHRTGEITLENFKHASVHTSLPAGYLNYGIITLNLVDGTTLRFPYIESPNTFQAHFQNAIATRRDTLLRQSNASQAIQETSQ